MRTVEINNRVYAVVPENYEQSCEGCVGEDWANCRELSEAIRCKATETIAEELDITHIPHLEQTNQGESND